MDGVELGVTDRWRVYDAAVYMAWGDRQLAADEISAVRAVAEELELGAGPRCPGRSLREGPTDLADIGLERAPWWVRCLAYGTASWIAWADGHHHPAERAIARTLRFRLGLDDATSLLLEASARLVGAHRHGADARAQYRALLAAIADVMPPEDAPFEPSA